MAWAPWRKRSSRGVPGAATLGRVLQNQVPGVDASNAFSFSVTIVSLLVTALLACGLPSWRASRIAPAIALR